MYKQDFLLPILRSRKANRHMLQNTFIDSFDILTYKRVYILKRKIIYMLVVNMYKQ